MLKKETVLILGNGYVAAHMAKKLLPNYNVYVTTRSDDNFASIQSIGAKPILFGKKLPEVEYVINTIPPFEDDDPALKTYTEEDFGNKLKWFGYISTTGVYGNTHGLPVTEDSFTSPVSKRSQARINVEKQLKNSKLPAVIFRVGAIYGPGRNLLERIISGQIKEQPTDIMTIGRVHIDDLVNIIITAMSKAKKGSIYNVVDDYPAATREVLNYAAKLLNWEEELKKMPLAASNESGPMGDGWRCVVNDKVKNELKIAFKYPSFQEGLDALIKNISKDNS